MKILKIKSSYANIIKKKKYIKNEINYNLDKSLYQNKNINKLVRLITITKNTKKRTAIKRSWIEKTCLLTGRFNSINPIYRMARHQLKYYALLGRLHNLHGQSW